MIRGFPVVGKPRFFVRKPKNLEIAHGVALKFSREFEHISRRYDNIFREFENNSRRYAQIF